MQDKTGSKFFAVSLAALFADYLLTMALWSWMGLSLAFSAAIAFIVIGALAYGVHEFWTFKSEASSLSGQRMLKNGAVLGIAFIGRVGTVALLELFRTPNAMLGTAYFVLGAGVSYSINYVLNRYWVFQR